MEIHERILQIRKELKLTRNEFGDKIGVSGDVIANIEYDRLKKPEQKEPIYKLICKTFGISEKWLFFGQGSPYDKGNIQTVLMQISDQLMDEPDDSFKKEVMTILGMLPPDWWSKLKELQEEAIAVSKEYKKLTEVSKNE